MKQCKSCGADQGVVYLDPRKPDSREQDLCFTCFGDATRERMRELQAERDRLHVDYLNACSDNIGD